MSIKYSEKVLYTPRLSQSVPLPSVQAIDYVISPLGNMGVTDRVAMMTNTRERKSLQHHSNCVVTKYTRSCIIIYYAE